MKASITRKPSEVQGDHKQKARKTDFHPHTIVFMRKRTFAGATDRTGGAGDTIINLTGDKPQCKSINYLLTAGSIDRYGNGRSFLIYL